MTKNLYLFAAVFMMLRLAASASATVTVTPGGTGPFTVLENVIVNNARQITVRAEGHAAIFINVTATSGIEPIRYIRIQSVGWGTVDNQAILVVRENGGTIPWIHTIERTLPPFPLTAGELWVDVNISGVLGDPTAAHTGIVDAELISQVNAAAGINADMTSGPRFVTANTATTSTL